METLTYADRCYGEISPWIKKVKDVGMQGLVLYTGWTGKVYLVRWHFDKDLKGVRG